MNEISKVSEIIVCPECSGKGYLSKIVRQSAYDEEYEDYECYLCDGKRVVNKIITVIYDKVKR